MQASEILFRGSGCGHIMGEMGLTEKQAKSLNELSLKSNRTDAQNKTLAELIEKRDSATLPETCITHLIDLFISANYGRREEATGKHLDKGNAREEESITLLSRKMKIMFKKNVLRLSNGYITGEPDIYLGESIDNATETFDTKTSWSAHTFFRAKHKTLEKLYKWQGVAYMALTGAQRHTVAYCLVNGTPEAIGREKILLSYQPGMLDVGRNEIEEYKRRCAQIEINHIFDMEAFKKENPGYVFYCKDDTSHDIPFQERIFTRTFDRNEDEIKALYDRIDLCRKWMNENLFNIPQPA